ncbi:NaeI family type II restriction endonuclease [Kitasatospora misakiensis]|uniref:NaeI family type II restriction endonuclease n=1 Tax=Kitasatospora misakiensis TaxID=67330 RepID=A0ABW0X6N5_9ACTN
MPDANFQKSPLSQRYSSWIHGGANHEEGERAKFFESGIVVLDTNILLSLYEYTSPSRAEIISALRIISARLWLPYQVGLEFVNGRRRVLIRQSEELSQARALTEKKFNEALKIIKSHSAHIESLVGRYSRSIEEPSEINSLIDEFSQTGKVWKSKILGVISDIRSSQDMSATGISDTDPVLEQVADLYGPRIADKPHPEVVQKRTRSAIDYRFPNHIPPGFLDDGKDTEIERAGDFLIWEEVIEYAKASRVDRVLFVSNDTKEDWYEPAGPGQETRPWPALFEEMKDRAGCDLRIETAAEFFDGVEQFLNATIATATLEEIDHVADEANTEFFFDLDGVDDTELLEVLSNIKERDPTGELMRSCIGDAITIAFDFPKNSAQSIADRSGSAIIAATLIGRNISNRFSFEAADYGDFLVGEILVDLKFTTRRNPAIRVSNAPSGSICFFVWCSPHLSTYSAGLFRVPEELISQVHRVIRQVYPERMREVHWIARNASLTS